ncbi:MAG TPA: M48 family metalloprotease [Vicinamibacterales bacterium]|nr:M48 family metalloprotease [Vicinamibacterales bacterium]
MKKSAVSLGLAAALVATVGAGPAFAQFGRLNDLANKAAKVKKIADLKVTDAEEHQIGQEVSDKIVETFGVYQDANVTKYVTLVGAVLAQSSPRPGLDWQFVVLDTEGVNAFAAPGGFIHITKGLLGLMKNEAELAGVLAHEITHVTEKHTVNAIQKGDTVKVASDEVGSSGGMTQGLLTKLAEKAYSDILNNKFSRDDEGEADEKGVQLANKVGYAPNGLATALMKLADRNKDTQEPNGLFASHPQSKDRIAKIDGFIKQNKLTATATVQARYAKNITFDAKPASAIATVAEGSRGLAGGEEKKPADAAKTDEAKKEEPKKSSGGMFSKLRPGGGSQAQQSQTVASAGARGVNPDRDAVGGPNKKRVPVKIGPSDIAEFQKGIA